MNHLVALDETEGVLFVKQRESTKAKAPSVHWRLQVFQGADSLCSISIFTTCQQGQVR